jgi:hypothetical protein
MNRHLASVAFAAPLSVLLLTAVACSGGTETEQENNNEIVIVGSVWAGATTNPNGTRTPINPVAGAVVSTSLTSRTATTDAAGHFVLHTEFDDHNCSTYTVKVTAAGHPTYERQWKGGGPNGGEFSIILSLGEPKFDTSGDCSVR